MTDGVVRIEHTVRATTDTQAQNIFRLAANRLLQVRNWNRLANSLLFASEHRDVHGAPMSRPAKADDYINLTSDEQRPFGWMQIVFVAESVSKDGAEAILISRPVGLPFDADNASSQAKPAVLRVVRKGLEITSGIILEANPLVTVFERLGVYVVQWRSLVIGLLSDLGQAGDYVVPEIAGTESHYA
ncbi:hypothetical protein WBG78_15310 [Chryseolinea sp. T2]|uniref:hypothetical protein n=1 Tax=Chryseolinea sp. T2 TaxID=3129255 RepID=UPI003076B71C